MDEQVIKQNIQNAYSEPSAPEALIQAVTLRAQAITAGRDALQQLEATPTENTHHLVATVLIGQLAAMTELPQGVQPQQLVQQLETAPALSAALQGGNLMQRLTSGKLMQQLASRGATAEQAAPQAPTPKQEGPSL